jgi:PEP-CTERM motif-containing protein
MKRALLPLAVLGFLAVSVPAMAVPTRAIFGYSDTSIVQLVIDGTTIIQASSTGWYSDVGFHDDANPNYFAGLCGDGCTPTGELRDFAVFDLGEFTGGATSAVIRLFNPLTPFAGYISPNPSELFRLYDVSTGVRDLVLDQIDATDIFADLGSGLVFGSRVVSAADDGTFVEIALTAEGLASLDSAVGSWAVGGALDLSREPGPEPEPVPEPTTLLLLGSGLMIGRRLRKRS